MIKVTKNYKEPMYFMLTSNDLIQVRVTNSEELNDLCAIYGLDSKAMLRVWRENIKSHRGWTRVLSKADVAAIQACGNDYNDPDYE